MDINDIPEEWRRSVGRPPLGGEGAGRAKVLAIRMPDSMRLAISDIAVREGVTESVVARRAIVEYLLKDKGDGDDGRNDDGGVPDNPPNAPFSLGA